MALKVGHQTLLPEGPSLLRRIPSLDRPVFP
jgi:hypothetical protein